MPAAVNPLLVRFIQSLRAFRQARNSFMLKRDQKGVSKRSLGCQEEAGRGQNEVKKGQEGVRMRSRRLRRAQNEVKKAQEGSE